MAVEVVFIPVPAAPVVADQVAEAMVELVHQAATQAEAVVPIPAVAAEAVVDQVPAQQLVDQEVLVWLSYAMLADSVVLVAQ